ncbi:MAG: hypothetical protein ACPGVF_00540, partial [Flavobacteriaceae bacterium]
MNFTVLFFLFLTVVVLLSGLFVVKQQTSAIIERFGRFLVIRPSGLHIKIPFVTLQMDDELCLA